MNDLLDISRAPSRADDASHGEESTSRTGGHPGFNPLAAAIQGGRQVYLQRGQRFKPADPAHLNICSRLPAGTYTIGSTQEGFHFEQVENFGIAGKLYGDVDIRARRILATFVERPSGTGVLLSGNKGSGKTMLAKRISQLAREEHGFITIVISQPLYGEAFNTLLQNVSQPAVVIFDEFEKVYDRDDQPKLLTVFDGTYPSKKLFVLTCNDRYRVDGHMHNRPGRLFYAIEFGGLGPSFIREYCEANLRNRKHTNGVVNVGSFFAEFSFDMLMALVEEMNRYNESATQAMGILNIKPQSDAGTHYSIKVLRNGQPLLADRVYPEHLNRSPLALAEKFRIGLYVSSDDEDEELGANRTRRRAARRALRPGYITKEEVYEVTTADMQSYDASKGIFTFKTARADTMVIFQRELKALAFGLDYDAF